MPILSVTPRRSLGARLDDLLSSRFALQTPHNRMVRRERLSPALQHCLTSLAPSCTWRAYRTAEGVFCAIARVPPDDSGAPVGELEVYCLDDNAWVYSAAVWAHHSQHGWWLNSVLDPSYDCERGWWLGALVVPQVAPRIEAASDAQEFLQLARPAPNHLRIERPV